MASQINVSELTVYKVYLNYIKIYNNQIDGFKSEVLMYLDFNKAMDDALEIAKNFTIDNNHLPYGYQSLLKNIKSIQDCEDDSFELEIEMDKVIDELAEKIKKSIKYRWYSVDDTPMDDNQVLEDADIPVFEIYLIKSTLEFNKDIINTSISEAHT